MARITIEDCLKAGYNKYMLVHLAAKRVIQFRKGKEPLLTTTNTEIVTALREIAAGKIRMRESSNLIEDNLVEKDLIGDNLGEESEISDKGNDGEVSQSEDPSDNTE
ncbi:MAG: DNA-directed RNA polymerase subunit omega [Proteobacteria bacterium]|nr:DNA-directed RNA polymerase subunit omega [Pseudomonadota bacterium]